MSESPDTHNTGRESERRAGQAYLLVGVSLLLVLIIGTVVQLVHFHVGLVVTELVLILLPAILFVRWKRIRIVEALRLRPITPRTGLLSVAVGVSGWGVAAGIHELLRPLIGSTPAFPGLEPETVGQLLIMLLCMAVLPGICEEALFRGAVQGTLRRQGAGRAVVVTALLFAFFHLSPWILVPGFFLGLVFGTMVVRTGSTFSSMLAHTANNATAVTVAYLFRDQSESSVYVFMGIAAAAFAVFFPIFWITTRGADPAPPILAKVPAGVPRPIAWAVGAVGAGAVILIGGVMAAIVVFFDFHVMTSDALAPEVRQGDHVVTVTRLNPRVGDIVSYDRDGRVFLRRISRIEDDRTWVRDGDTELELSRDEIMGKVVHIIEASPSRDEP